MCVRSPILFTTFLGIAFCDGITRADVISNSDFGIHSDVLDLDGDGIGIGQVEPNRPGKPDYDTDPTKYNTFVVPTGVYLQNGPVAMNANIDTFGMMSPTSAIIPLGWPA